MFIDEQTKLFLLDVLSEAELPIGTAIGTDTSNPYDTLAKKLFSGKTGGAKELKPQIIAAKKENKDEEFDLAKEAIKTSFAQTTGFDPETAATTTGGPSLEYLAGLGVLKRSLGYDTRDPNAELIDFSIRRDKAGNIDLGKTAVGVGKNLLGRASSYGLAQAALNMGGMGELGTKLSGKLGRLALLGVDPFDYATKVMGVDYVSDQLKKLPARQRQQITSGGGNITL
jgi:hypothetical protein